MKQRIGLIGLGSSWQTRHRPALRMLHDRFDVRAVFSSVAKLAEKSASEFQADPVDGYAPLIRGGKDFHSRMLGDIGHAKTVDRSNGESHEQQAGAALHKCGVCRRRDSGSLGNTNLNRLTES